MIVIYIFWYNDFENGRFKGVFWLRVNFILDIVLRIVGNEIELNRVYYINVDNFMVI